MCEAVRETGCRSGGVGDSSSILVTYVLLITCIIIGDRWTSCPTIKKSFPWYGWCSVLQPSGSTTWARIGDPGAPAVRGAVCSVATVTRTISLRRIDNCVCVAPQTTRLPIAACQPSIHHRFLYSVGIGLANCRCTRSPPTFVSTALVE